MPEEPITPEYEDDDIPFQLPKANNFYDGDVLSDSELRAQDVPEERPAPSKADATIDLPEVRKDDTDEIPEDVLKRARTAITGGDADKDTLATSYSAIDKAAKTGLIKENTANRYKSRLAGASKRAAK